MIIPRPDKVFITPIYDPDRIGSIYVPEQAKERVDQGVVKYVGASCKYLQPGDYVLFSGYAGETVNLEGEGLLIAMLERQVLAIIGDIDWTATPVPGLYMRDREGKFFPATVEVAIDLIRDAYANAEKIRPPLKWRKIDRRFFEPEDVIAIEEEWDDMKSFNETSDAK